jgi:p-aminobenzoyl-glutamate transporter AbgT
MGKLGQTVILSVIFMGVLVFLVIASGSGPQAWAIVQPVLASVTGVFKTAASR